MEKIQSVSKKKWAKRKCLKRKLEHLKARYKSFPALIFFVGFICINIGGLNLVFRLKEKQAFWIDKKNQSVAKK